jgi:hypothetical protein
MSHWLGAAGSRITNGSRHDIAASFGAHQAQGAWALLQTGSVVTRFQVYRSAETARPIRCVHWKPGLSVTPV